MIQKARGVSLLELTVGAALMGLLFMSGLQLLSSLFTVQAKLNQAAPALFLKPLLLETRLRILLQDADQVGLNEQSNTLTFNKNNEMQTLKLKKTTQGWQLQLNQAVYAQWKGYATDTKPAFDLPAANLLKVQLAPQRPPLLIWLRNQ